MGHESSADFMALVRRMVLLVQRLDRNSADAIGVNVTDLACLSLIENAQEPLTAKSISGLLGISTGSTTALLDRLEKRGLLARQPHPTDRRAVVIVPGANATRPDIQRARNNFRDIIEQTFQSLPPTDLEATGRVLEAVHETVSRHLMLEHR